MKFNLIKFWYGLPRFKVTFKIRKEHLDSRTYEWYLDRKTYGFDERELWNLSSDLDSKIRHYLQLPKSDDYVTQEEYTKWINDPNVTHDIKEYCKRVDRYVSRDCPYTLYDKDIPGFVDEKTIKGILIKYVDLLETRANNVFLSEEEIAFLYKYDHFGW